MTVQQYNQDAEESLLGAMLLSATAIETAVEIVQADDFYLSSHALIYQACVDLWGRQQHVDGVTVSEVLRASSDPDTSLSRLKELTILTPAASGAARYASIVRETAVARSLQRAGETIASLAAARETAADELVEQAAELVYRVSRRNTSRAGQPVSAAVHEAFTSMIEAHEHGGPQGARTGYHDIDHLVGAIEYGNVMIVGARPSVGKTSIALGILLHHTTVRQEPALFFSMEMSQREIGQRLLSMHARVPLTNIRSGRVEGEEMERVCKSAAVIDGLGHTLTIDTASRNVSAVRQELRRCKARNPSLNLAVLDYIQLMREPGTRENRNAELSHISREIKHTAGEYQTAFVCLAQLNRQSETLARRPGLSDLRDSGSLEQDADFVLLLHRKNDEENVITVQVEKNRNGPTGDTELTFMKPTATFRNHMRAA